MTEGLKLKDHLSKFPILTIDQYGDSELLTCYEEWGDQVDEWFKTLEKTLKETVSQIPSVTSTAQDNLLKSKKWNSLEVIAEEVGVGVRKNLTISFDLMEIQELVGNAIEDFSESVEKDLKALLEGSSGDAEKRAKK